MALPTSVNYESLQQVVREEIITTFQHESLLSLFPAVDIPDGIAAEEWAQKYMKESKRAALHRRGYNPNKVTMDFSGFSLKPVTIDQEEVLTEIDLAQFQKNGMLPQIVPEIGKNLAYTSNTYVMSGKGGNGESNPIAGQYNWVLEAGTGNGSAARPIPFYDASGGAWSTHATMRSDIGAWIGGCQAKGMNIAQSVILAPNAASPTLKTIRSEYNDHDIEFYLRNTGVRDIIYVEDEFFPTIVDGTTLATSILFDLIVIDPSEFLAGYQRPETVDSFPGTKPDRNYYIQAEVWPCLFPVPTRKNESGTIKTYKHMGRCSDITIA